MTPEETINRFMRQTVDLLLASPGYTIKAKQDGAPRPTGPYASMDTMADISVGWEQQELANNQSDPDLTETITGMREITMSINFFREGALDNARSVRTGLTRESVQDLFRQAGLGLTRRSEVREVDLAYENGWEERAQLDVTVSAVGTDSDIITSIMSANIAGVYEARGLAYNFTIEVQ